MRYGIEQALGRTLARNVGVNFAKPGLHRANGYQSNQNVLSTVTLPLKPRHRDFFGASKVKQYAPDQWAI